MSLKRRFGKYYYYFDSQFNHPVRAYAQAKALRRAGNSAKVKKSGELWIVWVK